MAKTSQVDPFAARKGDGQRSSSQPLFHQHGAEVQRFGDMRLLPTDTSMDQR